MSFLGRIIHHNADKSGGSEHRQPSAPPEWTPAPEEVHAFGLLPENEAPREEFLSAEQFCDDNAVQPPQLLPSVVVERINEIRCRAWSIEPPHSKRFVGTIENDNKGGLGVRIITQQQCESVSLLSNLPIMAGLYDIKGKAGVYFEVKIHHMGGIVAIGTACRPYPSWRLPGWNRLSSGLHLDDLRKFFEDPDGGRDYTNLLTRISDGDTIGCGFEFSSGIVFYTYNGQRLPPAFTGVYLPRQNFDVYAAIGVEGQNSLEVNFGADLFLWGEGNEWSWRVEGHVGRLAGGPGGGDEQLPEYSKTTVTYQ